MECELPHRYESKYKNLTVNKIKLVDMFVQLVPMKQVLAWVSQGIIII